MAPRKLPTFRFGTCVGRRRTLTSEAKLLLHPQRRTLTSQTLSTAPTLSRIFDLPLVSAIGRLLDRTRDCSATRNGGRFTFPSLPQRQKFTSFNGPTVPYLAGFSKFFCGVGDRTDLQTLRGVDDRMDLQTLRGVGDRTVLESDARSLRHPQRRRLTPRILPQQRNSTSSSGPAAHTEAIFLNSSAHC